jgi:hypothetical protein
MTARLVVAYLAGFLLFQLGLAVALIAEHKGRPFGQWLLFGLTMPIPSFALVLLARDDQEATGSRACPWCAETISRRAALCRFCHLAVEPVPSAGQLAWSVGSQPTTPDTDEPDADGLRG